MQTVLVVDDNQDLCQLYRRVLLRAGYSVELAENGLEAVNQIKTKNFDLVILDVNMPVMSGLDVISWVRLEHAGPQPKVIIITSNTMVEHMDTSNLADLLLTKPVSLGDLVLFTRRLLSQDSSQMRA